MTERSGADAVKAGAWDAHWRSLESRRSVFRALSVATRRFVFQPAVAFYARRFFAPTGVFLEAGCGTAESSATMERARRKLVGLDFSEAALQAAQIIGHMDGLLQADVFALPLKSNSIDGIWNLGVMEHFTEAQISACLKEFRRVLKPGGVILLFWPAENNASRWLLGPIERVIGRHHKAKFTFFPDEISRLRSKQQAQQLLRREGFNVRAIDFNWRTAFIHVVIAATT